MPLAVMTVIMLLILFLTGALERTGFALCLPKYHIYYFLLCSLALYGFELAPVPELTLAPVCLMILISAALLSSKRNEGQSLLVIPFAALFGLFIAVSEQFFDGSELAICAAAALSALPVLLTKKDITFCLAVAAAAPVLARLTHFFAELISIGYAGASFDKGAADLQLIGILAVCALYEFKSFLSSRANAGHGKNKGAAELP